METGLESGRRSSHEEESGRRDSDAGPWQLICYTRRRRKVLSPASASATTSTQLADDRRHTEDDGEYNEDTGSNRDVRRGPVYGYFPGNVSFAAIHEHRTGIDVESPKRAEELSPFIRKRRRRDVAPPVTTSVETGPNCNKKPAPQRQTEPTDVQFVWKTFYPNVPYPEGDEHHTSIDVEKSGESGPSSRSPTRVGELSPSIRKSKRRRDVAPPVTTNVETGTNYSKPAPQRQREPTDWKTFYPNVPYLEDVSHEHRTSIDVEKSGKSSRSPKRVGELSPSIRKQKRTRRDVAPPVTSSIETGTNCNNPAPQRLREPTDVEFEWGTYYPEVMRMSWGPWSRSRKEAISETARSMKLQKKKKSRKARHTFPSTASLDEFAQIIDRTFADSRIVRCPNPLCEYHYRAIPSQAL